MMMARTVARGGIANEGPEVVFYLGPKHVFSDALTVAGWASVTHFLFGTLSDRATEEPPSARRDVGHRMKVRRHLVLPVVLDGAFHELEDRLVQVVAGVDHSAVGTRLVRSAACTSARVQHQ